jgi:hypothetical protein
VVNKDIDKNAVHSMKPTSGTQFLLLWENINENCIDKQDVDKRDIKLA